MLDAVGELFLRTVGAFLLEVLLLRIGYWPGWLILKILTFGAYPPPKSREHNQYYIGGVPYLALLVWLTVHFS